MCPSSIPPSKPGKPWAWTGARRSPRRAPHPKATDPEAALYDAFLEDADRSRTRVLQQALAADVWEEMDFRDRRLRELAVRLKARSFGHLLSEAEQAGWREFVSDKLMQDGPWLGLAGFRARIAALRAELPAAAPGTPAANPRAAGVLAALDAHADALALRYGLSA